MRRAIYSFYTNRKAHNFIILPKNLRDLSQMSGIIGTEHWKPGFIKFSSIVLVWGRRTCSYWQLPPLSKWLFLCVSKVENKSATWQL